MAALVTSQIAQAADGQSVGILDALLGQSLDVARKSAADRVVEVSPGHARIDVDRAGKRFCDVFK